MAVKEKDHSNDTQDCSLTWKDQLKQAKNGYAVQKSLTDKAYVEYTNSAVWENKLKVYWDNIQATNELGKKISNELLLFKKHTDRVCTNTQCTVEALEYLFCIVKDFFDCTDQLKGELSDLQKLIDCLNNPDLKPGSSIILTCLKDFSDKLDAAIAGQHDLLKMVINVLKCARQLHESVCSTDCSLTTQLDDLICLFNTPESEGEAASDDHDCGDSSQSCHGMLKPKPAMPLEDDPYYKKTKDQFEKSEQETDQLESDYNAAREEAEKILSYKNSLMDAINAAEAAKDCK